MKYVLMRMRTVRTLEFYEVEGENANQAAITEGLFLDRSVMSDTSTVCSGICESDKATAWIKTMKARHEAR